MGASAISDVEAQVAQAINAGYPAVKLKVAATNTNTDIERIRVAAKLANEKALLRLDANGGWSNNEASQVLRAVADEQIDLVEEPTQDPSGWRAISTQTGLKIGADEHLSGSFQIDRILELEAAHTFVLKPSVLGGPSFTRRTRFSSCRTQHSRSNFIISRWTDCTQSSSRSGARPRSP